MAELGPNSGPSDTMACAILPPKLLKHPRFPYEPNRLTWSLFLPGLLHMCIYVSTPGHLGYRSEGGQAALWPWHAWNGESSLRALSFHMGPRLSVKTGLCEATHHTLLTWDKHSLGRIQEVGRSSPPHGKLVCSRVWSYSRHAWLKCG